MKKKLFISVVAVALVACFAIGGTLAWLTDTTDPVTNTFTVGNINITLEESPNLNLKMVPGATITKDPVATVEAGSEDCYLFVKVEKSANFDNFMTYQMATGWTELETGVYYREVSNSDKDQPFDVLLNDTVTVLDSVDKDMLDAIVKNPETAPTLTFTAYAVQLYESNTEKFEPAEAWAKVAPQA